LRFLVGLGAVSSDIGTSSPDGRHDAQFLSNFLKGGVLWKPLKSVSYGLFVRHKKRLPLNAAGCKLALKISGRPEQRLRYRAART
jgi:hypothetical protein